MLMRDDIASLWRLHAAAGALTGVAKSKGIS